MFYVWFVSGFMGLGIVCVGKKLAALMGRENEFGTEAALIISLGIVGAVALVKTLK